MIPDSWLLDYPTFHFWIAVVALTCLVFIVDIWRRTRRLEMTQKTMCPKCVLPTAIHTLKCEHCGFLRKRSITYISIVSRG